MSESESSIPGFTIFEPDNIETVGMYPVNIGPNGIQFIDEDNTSELTENILRIFDMIENSKQSDFINCKPILTCFSNFEKKYKDIYHNIYNSYTYDWYYGNVLHFMLSICFCPELYRSNTIVSDSIKAQFLSKFYELVINKTCSVISGNYYFETVYEHILFIEKKYNFDITYDNYFNGFKIIAKYGKEVVGIQKYFISRYAKKHRKKKNAIKLIENYWFELIHNPYSKYGKKNIAKVSDKFNKALESMKKLNVKNVND